MNPYILVFQFLAFTSVFAEISDKEYVQMPDILRIGNYDKCVMYGEEHYFCMIRIWLQPNTPQQPSKTWKIIEKATIDQSFFRRDLLRHGVCIPETFPNISSSTYQNEAKLQRKLVEYYDKKFENLGLKTNVTVVTCHGQKTNDSYDVYTLLFGITVVMYGLILLYATFNDVVMSSRSKEEQEKLAETFMGKLSSAVSFRKNWQRLMTVNTLTPDMQALRCVQGYRVYNMAYVILFHGAVSHLARFKTNPNYVERLAQDPVIIVYDMSYVMQIFFMLSGFMFSYQFLADEEKGIKMNLKQLFKYLVKRYIRLTPVFAFFIFFACTWLRYISSGPIWSYFVNLTYAPCREHWWANIMYINNIVHVERMCFVTTWYLGVNMQLYILSFLILCIISKYRKKTIHIFGVLIIGHIVCLFIPIYLNNNYHMVTREAFGHLDRNLFEDPTFLFLHLSLYTNSAGVIAGLIIGHIFFKYRNKNLFNQKWHVVLWWILSCGMPLMVILMDTWIYNDTPLYNASFGSTKKLIFAFGNGLLLLGMTKGQGWVLKWLCETSFIYVLGRLTYCAYIIHSIIQFVYAASQRNLIHVDFSTLATESMGDIAMSFVLAVFATLFVEMPIIELHKWLTAKESATEAKKVV